MGWSCEYVAGIVMENIMSLTGKDGFVHHNGGKYFFDVSNKEYKDGRIHVTVYEAIDDCRAVKVGSFYIMPGGRISERALAKFPFLKKALN